MKPRAQRTGLLKRTVGDQVVVYDQARQQLHVLNPTTALVWSHCDGNKTIAEIAAAVAPSVDAQANLGVIELALAQLEEAHLLEPAVSASPATEEMTRRKMLQAAAAVAVGVLLPSITSCGFPIAPDAKSLVDGAAVLDMHVTTTTSTTGTTTSTTSTTGTSTSTTSTTTPLVTTTSTTSTTPAFTTTTSTTTPLVTTTSTTSTSTTSTTTTSTTTTTPQPRKVEMCHKGKTITVDRHAVPGLLRAGAKIGPCP